MSPTNRRDFLKMSATAAAAGLVPNAIRRALALPASSRTGTIQDVEHVVIFMQENRSFDHYLGHLRGVRGYNDRFPVPRSDGRSVWFQPRRADAEQVVLPFHLETQHTSAECVLDLDHSWYPTHGALASGRNDRWPEHKSDMTMGYYLRDDIPFHYALADAFTVCDAYFCSTPNQTHPNRMYLMTGMVDPTGKGGGPLLDNNDYVDEHYVKRFLPPFTYTTYPERLQAAGISWQVYQQGVSGDDNYNGNFGTNILGNFKQFIEAPDGSPLQRRGMSVRTIAQLAEDVAADRLPQVSWLLPPAAYSEHPRWTPGYGATYIAQILDALTSNPEVWSKTAMFLMYDENDGYFDHVMPPQPPTSALPGKSTVSTEGEIHNYVNPLNLNRYHVDNLPYGLGPRVPMIVISPWSKGGYVCSEVFDHTSILRFVEARFGVNEPNITPWRRTVCGDLTSTFDFRNPNSGWPKLPDTSGYVAKIQAECKLEKPGVPAQSEEGDIVAQEEGIRNARKLPYDLAVDEVFASQPGDSNAGSFTLTMQNHGTLGVCFYVYRQSTEEAPRRYTIEAGKHLEDSWSVSSEGYHFILMGPNGYFRSFQGRGSEEPVQIRCRHDRQSGGIVLKMVNLSADTRTVEVLDNAYGHPKREYKLRPHQEVNDHWDLKKSGHWYDLSVHCKADDGYARRLAGHVETGRDSISDPAAREPVLKTVLVRV
jgi:phospholipase C